MRAEQNILHQLIGRFADKRMLAVGDLMLDEFVWGRVSRISPEAPVPVVNVTSETYYPGGAANVARNLREFMRDTAVMGLAGTDRTGRRLVELLETAGMRTEGVLQEDGASTIVKTRVIGRFLPPAAWKTSKLVRTCLPWMKTLKTRWPALLQ